MAYHCYLSKYKTDGNEVRIQTGVDRWTRNNFEITEQKKNRVELAISLMQESWRLVNRLSSGSLIMAELLSGLALGFQSWPSCQSGLDNNILCGRIIRNLRIHLSDGLGLQWPLITCQYFSALWNLLQKFPCLFINFFEVVNNVDQLFKYDTVRTYPICP